MINESTARSERGVFSWVILGPISMLLSLSLLTLKTPTEFYSLPLTAIVGVGLTSVFRLKGLLGSLGLLFAVAAYEISMNVQTDSLWFIGSTFTMAFSFLITFLTIEEAGEVVGSWREAALKYTHEMTHSESKIQSLEEELTKEKTKLVARVKELETEQKSALLQYETLEKIQELSRIELISSLSKQDELLEELFSSRHKIKKFEEQSETVSSTLEGHRKLIDKLQNENAMNKEMSAHIQTLTREKDLLESTLSHLQEELDQLEIAKNTAEAKAQEVREVIVEVPVTVEVPVKVEPILSDEFLDIPPANESEFRRLFGMHRQIREQFVEKSATLDSTRKELFIVSEKANLLEREIKELEAKESPELLQLTGELDRLAQKYESALKEIASLEELISTLNS